MRETIRQGFFGGWVGAVLTLILAAATGDPDHVCLGAAALLLVGGTMVLAIRAI